MAKTIGEAWSESMASDIEQKEKERKANLNIQKTKNMGYKQGPFPMVDGTKGHSSALKQKIHVKPEKTEDVGKYHYTKAKKRKPGDKYYVHKYLKKGSVNVDHPGVGGGTGRLKHGYPKWVKK